MHYDLMVSNFEQLHDEIKKDKYLLECYDNSRYTAYVFDDHIVVKLYNLYESGKIWEFWFRVSMPDNIPHKRSAGEFDVEIKREIGTCFYDADIKEKIYDGYPGTGSWRMVQ